MAARSGGEVHGWLGRHLDGECVGHDLHGVVVVGEAVDDGHVGVVGELQDVAVAVQARHDDVVELGHDARDVPRLLALTDLDRVGVEVQRMATHAEEALRAAASGGGRTTRKGTPGRLGCGEVAWVQNQACGVSERRGVLRRE